MSLKQFKPTTPSSRARRIVDKSCLWKGAPYKPLTQGKDRSGGRNHQGRITVRHRGGGTKRSYRNLNFHPIPPTQVVRLEHDPNRSAFIALVREPQSNIHHYRLAAEGIQPGAMLDNSSLSLGATLPLYKIPLGSTIHQIESYPGSGGKLQRAAGTSATLTALSPTQATLTLSSKKVITLSPLCHASLGKVSNSSYKNQVRGKAGATRWLGWRAKVKGNSMNPVDHPHGGKTKRGFLPRSPWGKITRGKKTT